MSTAFPPPPTGLPRPARSEILPAGTTLWRVHSRRFGCTQMNPTAQPTVDAGGRFDSIDGAFAYLYAADSVDGAIAETLCRDLPSALRGPRIVPRAAVTGRILSPITVTADLSVAALHGAHLTVIGQSLWLTKCDAAEYLLTRQWAAAIFAADPSLEGLAYRPRHNEDHRAWMLTTAPDVTTHPGLHVADGAIALDAGKGLELVQTVLEEHNATLSHLPR